MKDVLTMLDPRVRLIFYVALGVFAVVIGSLDVYFAENDPEWVKGLVRVSVWLTPLVALPAATHVPAKTTEHVARHRDLDGDGAAG